ncbi:MAG: type II toxin-antitoxin system RelE/ParE family toxin [Bacteroides sp.]|nr:type II toxin-antitoxin system RelE/ParE family toxin [Bacteroides sp.]
MKIIWYEDAVADMDQIYEFYTAGSDRSATNLFNQIIEETKRLLNFPYMAALEPLLMDEPESYRSIVVRSHFKIIYFVDEKQETIVIVRVWDCRQNPDNLRVD